MSYAVVARWVAQDEHKDEIDRAIELNECRQRGREGGRPPAVWSQLSTTFSPTSGERAVRFGFRPWMSPRRLRA
jgi:hypothetical protein